MSLPGHRFTYSDYCLLPEDKRYELLEGDLFVTPTPNVRHQKIQMVIAARLFSFVENCGLGEVLVAPTDVILSDENVVQPDVLFVSEERLGIMNLAGGIHGAPDLVVEILSPSTAPRDQVVKRKLYSRYGVKEFWIVDPGAGTVEVLTQSEGELQSWQTFAHGDTLRSLLLPDFTADVSDLIRE